jgi:membrane-associated PAP2 superfamily phosphatase
MKNISTYEKRRYGLILFGSTWFLGMLGLIPVDEAWTLWIRQHRIRWLDRWMDQTLFEGEPLGGGDPVVLFLLIAAVLYYMAWKKGLASRLSRWRPHLGFILVSALTSSVMMVHSLKWVMGRARPSPVFKGQLPFSGWFEFGPHFITEGIYHGSFPSGHTAQAFTLMTLSYVLLLAADRRHYQRAIGWAWGCFSLVYTGLMGLTRCMKLTHWLSDVVFSVGCSWMLMHLIYYHLLDVPAQEAYFQQHGQYPQQPSAWELRLCLVLFFAALGGMLLLLGIRSVLLDTGWLLQASLLAAGALTTGYFGMKLLQLRRSILAGLYFGPDNEVS